MTTTAMSLDSVSAIPIKMAACVASNDTLLGPLGPVIERFTGAFGGLLFPAAIFMIVLYGVILIFTIKRDSSGTIRAIVAIAGVVVALPLLILVLGSIFTYMNDLC